MCFRFALLHSTMYMYMYMYLYFLYRSPPSQNSAIFDATRITASTWHILIILPQRSWFSVISMSITRNDWSILTAQMFPVSVLSILLCLMTLLRSSHSVPTRIPDRVTDNRYMYLLDLFLCSNPNVCTPTILAPL